MNRIIVGYIGILFIFIGMATFIHPSFYHSVYGVTINFSNVKWPFSIMSTGFGVICVYVAISKKYLGDKVEYWICPKCQETFKLSGSKKHNCPKCKIFLEKLKGFYERHPE